MPLPPRVAAVRRAAVRFGLVRDEQDLGILGVTVAWQRLVPIELAKAAAELDVLFARDLLIAKEQDAVSQKSLVDLAEERLAHGLRDVHITDFGAECVRELAE